MSFSLTDSPPTPTYTLSLHDALPIYTTVGGGRILDPAPPRAPDATRLELLAGDDPVAIVDRKSTRLNSSHVAISYAVFCLKKKTLIFLQRVIGPRPIPFHSHIISFIG